MLLAVAQEETKVLLGRQVYDAAKDGDTQVLRKLLAENPGAPLDYRDEENDSTALHWASERGHFDCVRLLLNAGANIEISNKQTFRPLQYAAMFGTVDVIELLLSEGANINSTGELNYSAVHLASYSGAPNRLKTLLDRGADSSCVSSAGHSALDVAPSHHMQSIGPVLFAYGFPLDPAQIAGNMSPYHRPSGTVSVSQTFRDCLRMALAVVATRREAIAAGSVARLVVAFRTQLRAAVGDDPHSQVRALCDRRARFLILRSAAENTSRAVGHLAALRAAAGKLGGAGPPENGGGTTHDGGAAHAEALAALHAAEAQALADAGQCQSGLPSPTTSPASAASELVDGRSCCAEALASALALLDCAECALGDASMRTVRACWDALNAGPGSRGAKLQQYAAIRCVGRRGELTMLLSDAKQGVLGARAAVDAELAAINALKKRLEDAMRGLPAGTQQAAAANAGANAGGAAAVDDSDDEVVSVSSDDEQEDGVALV